MNKYYRLMFVYPDGHIEEIDDIFVEGKEALSYGESLLSQVHNTESFLDRGSNDTNEFGFKKTVEPYFMIIEFKGKRHSLVYDSRTR